MDNGVSDSPGLVTCLTKGFFKALTPGCSIFSIRSGPETVGVETAEGRAGVPSEKIIVCWKFQTISFSLFVILNFYVLYVI